MEETKSFFKIFGVGLKSFFISILLTIFFIFLLSIFLCYSNISEKIINAALIIISSICIMIGCIFMEKKMKEKGLLYGVIFGIIYMLGMFFISSFAGGDFSIEKNSIIMILLGIVAGGFGGIIGVNLFK